jgi:hypothetical protein
VSDCHELEVLMLPDLLADPLFPRGTAFACLTHLEICDDARRAPSDAGVMGLWELMASGGLPALTKFKWIVMDPWGPVEELKTRVTPALEAVAETLTHLSVSKKGVGYGKSRSEEVEVWYELGVAVGKLQRLKDLALHLSQDGRVYHTFAQGLAASGGGRPLPLLRRLAL